MGQLRKKSRLTSLESLEDRYLLHGNLGLTIDEVEVRENAGFVTVSVLRSGALDDLVTVDYATVEDTAKSDADFEPQSGTFTFPPNVVGQQIQIRIVNDGEAETAEQFRFELSNPTGGAELDRSSQTIRILDDESSGSQIFADDFEAGEIWTSNIFETDSATNGQWQVGAPQATEWNSQIIQPGNTAEGQRALITGTARIASAVSNDVDGGLTTVASPTLELPESEVIDLSFSYFFGHDQGSSDADYLQVAILPAEATQPETVFEVRGQPSHRIGQWKSELLDLSSFSGQSVRILITANDGDGESIVEAGIDNVSVDAFESSPGILSFATALVNVEEGIGATATIEVLRTRGRTGEVTVEIASSDDGATAGEDYTPVQETITFADGETSKSITVLITDDDAEETLENIRLTLSDPTGGAVLGDDSEAAIRIVDNDRFSFGLLPDLQAMEDNFDTNFIDLGQQPGRALYRFGTAVANAGDGALEIWGGEASGSTQEVLQRIYEPDGGFYDRLAGSFVYHAGHGHVHLEGFAEFHLRSIEDDGSVGPIIASGGKTSFCLINITQPYPEATAASLMPHGRGGSDCNTVQGISVGHADVYDAGLEGQWIDVTEIEDGDYYLEVIADPENALLEIDETNNVLQEIVSVDNPYFVDGEFVEIPEGTGGGGGGVTIPTAPIALEGPGEFSGRIQTDSPAIWYSFEAVAGSAYSGEVEINSVGKALGDSELRLRNASGAELVYDDDGGVGLGSRIAWIAPEDGTYYWQVSSLNSFGTGNYEFIFAELEDDHGSSAEDATELRVGRYTSGEIEFQNGEDWFSFEAAEGQYYRIDGIGLGADDVKVALIDTDGASEILSVDDRNSPGSSRAYWQAEEAGTYFVRLDAGDQFGFETGTYRIRVDDIDAPDDDFPNAIPEAADIALGVETEAEIDYELDQDVFAFTAEQGAEYIVQLDASTGGGDLQNPILQIVDADGSVLHEAKDGGQRIVFEWLADTNEPRFISVQGFDGRTGDYRLRVGPEAPDSTDGAVSATVPLTHRGDLHDAEDVDVFAFEAEAGVAYSLNTFSTEFADTYLTLIGPDGTTVVAENDDESGYSTGSRINWMATETGTHYVSVHAANERIGGFELFVNEGESEPITEALEDDYSNTPDLGTEAIRLNQTTSGVIDYQLDEDWFHYEASSGSRYNVTLAVDERVADSVEATEWPAVRVFNSAKELLFESSIAAGESRQSLDFLSPSSERIFIQVTNPQKGDFEIRLEEDDHGDNPSNARLAEIGVRISGDLESELDSDWFRIEPKPGMIYQAETFLPGTLGDSTLRVFDQNGQEQLYNDDADGLASRLAWAPTSDAPFFFEVDGLSGSAGTYEVIFTAFADDHGNSAAQATMSEVGTPIPGQLQISEDVDWFSIPVTQGTAYRAVTTNGSVSARMADGSLLNGVGGERASFLATEDGTMYFEVSSFAFAATDYELTIFELEDVHGDSADAASAMSVPVGVVNSDLEFEQDVDWFRFEPEAGKTYRFDVTNDEFGFARLQLFGKDGIARDAEGIQGFFWDYQSETPDEVLPHFLMVDGVPGPYTLEVTELDERPAEVGVEQLGLFDVDDERDWFSFQGQADSIYEIALVADSDDVRVRVFDGNTLQSSQTIAPSFYVQDQSPIRFEVSGPMTGTYRFSVQEVVPTEIDAPIDQQFEIATSGTSSWFTFETSPGVSYDVSASNSSAGNLSELRVVNGSPQGSTSWFAMESTEVLLQVTGAADNHDYQLEVVADEPEFLELDEDANGILITPGAVDWYQFPTVEGATYRIETTLTTLGDSVLELFNFQQNSLAFNDDGGDGLASRIDWVATETSRLFFQVRGFSGSDTGSYQVSVSQTAPPSQNVDLNGDGTFSAADIDLLFAATQSAEPTEEEIQRLDLNSDGVLNSVDIDEYLTRANVLPGDINLDNIVDFSDFLVISMRFGSQGTWSEGDVTGDGEVNFEDFLLVSLNFRQRS